MMRLNPPIPYFKQKMINHSGKPMATNGVRTNGNQWEPMGTNGNQWEPMGNQWGQTRL